MKICVFTILLMALLCGGCVRGSRVSEIEERLASTEQRVAALESAEVHRTKLEADAERLLKIGAEERVNLLRRVGALAESHNTLSGQIARCENDLATARTRNADEAKARISEVERRLSYFSSEMDFTRGDIEQLQADVRKLKRDFR